MTRRTAPEIPKVLTHTDEQNRAAMVDVSAKEPTLRTARARATVSLPPEVRALFRDGDLQSKKGPVFQTAILAGTMAAKKTHDLIPLCHPLMIERCRLDVRMDDTHENVLVDCEVSVHHRTGVEMEALTGASVAALTVYDMCKALSHALVIREIRLVSKTGGKSDFHG